MLILNNEIYTSTKNVRMGRNATLPNFASAGIIWDEVRGAAVWTGPRSRPRPDRADWFQVGPFRFFF